MHDLICQMIQICLVVFQVNDKTDVYNVGLNTSLDLRKRINDDVIFII